MTNGTMELIYHPALKEMKFRRLENGGWTDVNLNSSDLHKYVNQKDGVILQNLGSDFFDDLADSMDGMKEITINFTGTKLDWGDFINMIDHYNKNQSKGVFFTAGEFTKLKDMESLYQDIKLFSDETVNTLENTSANEVLASVKQKIDEQIEELKTKKIKLDDNTVNLCFVGTYSSGKSTLINAILGYEILPEAIKSETAKMFMLRSVNDNTDAGISFRIGTKTETWCVELRWDKTAKTFCFHSDIQGSDIRKAIQVCINENSDKPIHTQLRLILSVINIQPNFPDPKKQCDYVDGIITVSFPIPLNGDVCFTIYDTPGTDSNYNEHLSILKKALEEQTNSILIFVNYPKKMEGTGNSMLIRLLNSIEENATKSTIDVGRSLFVINGSDDILTNDGFDSLKNSEIVLDAPNSENLDQAEKINSKKIPLYDKRIFFTCAKAGYVGRARRNGIATEKENSIKKRWGVMILEDPAGFYKFNKMAQSENNTEQMIADARQAAEAAKGDEDDLFYINSGVYSLEKEIKNYGAKFAMAVKAKSIIDAVQAIINKFDKDVIALDHAKNKKKQELEKEIRELRETLVSQIKNELSSFKNQEKLNETEVLPNEIILKLELGDNARRALLGRINEIVKKIWGAGFVGNWIREDNRVALGKINQEFNGYYENYNSLSYKLIGEKVGMFNQIIIKIINECNIDDEVKERLLLIPEIDLGKAPSISDRVNIEGHLNRRIILFLDKDTYKDQIAAESAVIFDNSRENFIKDYRKRLSDKCGEMADLYLTNIDRYSGDLERLRDDKSAVEKELEQLKILLGDIKEKRAVLDKKIWGELNG